ncbi:MAG: LTA synthase family protein [Eubacterium sp.]|nr:LTA synthase family protein [Eubacterium sp.]
MDYERNGLSRKYKIFWAIYWAALVVLLLIFRKTVTEAFGTGDKGRFVFPGLLAAIIGSAIICTFVMKPRQRRDQHGRKVILRMRLWHLPIMAAVDVYAFLIIEYINNDTFLEMTIPYKLLNLAGICIMNLILLGWLNNLKRSLIAVVVIWSSMSAAFYYVMKFRGEPLQLIDFFSLGTAAEVAGGYSYSIPASVVIMIICSCCLIAILLHMKEYAPATKLLTKILLRAATVGFMIFGYFFYLNVNWNGNLGILTDLYRPAKTYAEYGTTVGFFCVAKYMRVTPPEGYSDQETEEIAKEASENKTDERTTDVKPVNVIAIMNESWADYRYIGDLQTNQDVMPYYDSMTENTIKGHTLVCITGGGTAKTEYEFLTGNSVKRFPSMVPYVSYFTHDQYSLVSTMKAQGYETMAMHPNKGSNWKRTSAYDLLGFDSFLTIDDFDPDAEQLHSHISDQANYEKIVDVIENKESADEPFFLFDITMQNHGGYSANDFTGDITVEGYNDPQVNRFLSLEKESDNALEYLIEYFKKVEEPTLIVMFGDHYPTLPDGFTEYISGANYDDLPFEQQEHYYATPFFIWANYDIPEETDVLTSTNFLGTMTLQQTGLQMPDYNYYLQNLQKEIPALNHLGYMDEDGVFRKWADATEEDADLEWEYECLQYNNLEKDRTRLDWFFGLDGS